MEIAAHHTCVLSGGGDPKHLGRMAWKRALEDHEIFLTVSKVS